MSSQITLLIITIITLFNHGHKRVCFQNSCYTVPCLVFPSLTFPPHGRLSAYLSAILYWSIASWYSLTATRKSPRIRCRTQSLWLASAFLSKAIPSSYFCSLPAKKKILIFLLTQHFENTLPSQIIYTKPQHSQSNNLFVDVLKRTVVWQEIRISSYEFLFH